ncbi:alpha/beta hydrolase [Myxococcaceae bacterium JPH2]|nr:alpha/beta hydrolase [Myxococcaceae bacterium JPH2]
MPVTGPEDRYAGVDPQARAFLAMLEARGGPPLSTLSPQAAREVLRDLQSGDVARMPAAVEDRVIPGGPSGQVHVRIVRPPGASGPLPVLVYCHGGGWVLGDGDTHDRLIRELAFGTRAAVVFIQFSPAPEARYPVQIEQAYAVLQWVANHGGVVGLDSGRIAVVGDGTGGNLAIALTMLARERGGPRIAQQVLFHPVTDARFDTASYERYAEGYFLTRQSMAWFWDCYVPDASARSLPLVSPLRAPAAKLKGLPPALIITGECDVVRDEGEAYAHRLIDVGVTVTPTRYLGVPHDFVVLDALASTPAARAAVIQACVTLVSVLGAGLRSGQPAIPTRPSGEAEVGPGASVH